MARTRTRLAAFLVDLLLVAAAAAMIGGWLFGEDPARAAALGGLMGIAYATHFWSASGGGQTLAMRALHIRVARADGAPLTLSGAFLRFMGLLVSIATLLGIIWPLWDRQRQGWHDKIAGTVVLTT